MNKLHQFKIWTMAALVLSLSACSSDEDASSKASDELLSVERVVAFGPTETSWEVKIVADCEWEVTAVDNIGWPELSVSPRSGEGNGVLVLTTEENHSSQDRTAVLTLSTKKGLKQDVTILQTRSGADLSINQDVFEFSDVAGTQTLIVNCNTDWEILGIMDLTDGDTNWLKLGQTSGSGNAEVPITVDETFDDADRYALLLISAGDLGDNILSFGIKQYGKQLITMSLDTIEQTFSAAGGTKKVKVSSNGAWSAAIPTDINWIHITPTAGIGNGEITITCDPYPGATLERLTTLTVSAGSKNPQRSDVIITQTAN
jgi:hypothetical protein